MNSSLMKERVIKAYKDLAEPVHVNDIRELLGITEKNPKNFAQCVHYYYRLGLLKKVSNFIYQWQPPGPPVPPAFKKRSFEERMMEKRTKQRMEKVATDAAENLKSRSQKIKMKKGKWAIKKDRVMAIAKYLHDFTPAKLYKFVSAEVPSVDTLYTLLSELVKDGKLIRTEVGNYTYPEKPIYRKSVGEKIKEKKEAMKKDREYEIIKVLWEIGDNVSLSTIYEALNPNYGFSNLHRILKDMVKDGRVYKPHKGFYSLAKGFYSLAKETPPVNINVVRMAPVKEKPMEVTEGPKLSVMSFEVLVNTNVTSEERIMDDMKDAISEIEDIKHVETRPAVEGKDYKAIIKMAFKK